jgi:hypothetical protein
MTLFYLHEVWTYSPWLVVRVGFTNWDYFLCKSHVDPIISYIHVIFPYYPLSILSLIHIIMIIPIIIWIIWYSHNYIYIYTDYVLYILSSHYTQIMFVKNQCSWWYPIIPYPHYDNIILWMVAKSCTSWKLVANYVKDFQLITLVNNTSWK